jgi:hypothetical protein
MQLLYKDTACHANISRELLDLCLKSATEQNRSTRPTGTTATMNDVYSRLLSSQSFPFNIVSLITFSFVRNLLKPYWQS